MNHYTAENQLFSRSMRSSESDCWLDCPEEYRVSCDQLSQGVFVEELRATRWWKALPKAGELWYLADRV